MLKIMELGFLAKGNGDSDSTNTIYNEDARIAAENRAAHMFGLNVEAAVKNALHPGIGSIFGGVGRYFEAHPAQVAAISFSVSTACLGILTLGLRRNGRH